MMSDISPSGPTFEHFYQKCVLLDVGDCIEWEGERVVIVSGELHGQMFSVIVHNDGDTKERTIHIPANAMIRGMRQVKDLNSVKKESEGNQ